MTNELMKMISELKEVSERILCNERTLNEEIFCEEERIQHRLFDLYMERYSIRNEYLYVQDMLHNLVQNLCYRSDEINKVSPLSRHEMKNLS